MRIKIFNLLILSALLLGGCGRKSEAKVPAADDLRILSLVTAADHIICELGCKEKIAAVDRHAKVLESMRDVPVTVAGSMVSREMLRKYRINYAVIWYYQRNLLPFFAKENIAVMVVEKQSLASYPLLVQKLGRLCNKESAARALTDKYEKTLQKMAVKEKSKSVYFELYTPWKTPSANGYISNVLQRAGLHLAAAGAVNGTVSPEAVVRSKPEVIFYVENFGSAEEIAARKALRNTPAVKNKRIYAVKRNLLCEGAFPGELMDFFREKTEGF